MNCPRCSATMKPQALSSVTIDRCSACGGTWLDATESEKIRALPGVADIDAGAASPNSPAVDPSREALQCPRCNTRMILLMVERQPPLYFDHCGNCNGVFLDAGELRAMTEVSLDEWLRATLPGIFRLRLPPPR